MNSCAFQAIRGYAHSVRGTQDQSASVAPLERPLWKCEVCGRGFANRNQTHSCGRYEIETHFRKKPQAIRALFEAVLETIRRCGPVTVLPEKTRIAFQVRMSFAQVTPRMKWLDGHLVLARRREHSLFRRIDTISARNHVHHFRLVTLTDIDQEFESLLKEAYAVGEQRHLNR